MGYYVAVRCKSVKARKELLAFMGEHFRPAAEFMDWVDQDNRMTTPTNGKDICAYAKANEVGWYRNAGWDAEHRHYASCLLRWMAMKVGKQMLMQKDQVPGYGEMLVGYTLYEGDHSPFVLRSLCPDAPDGLDAEGYVVCDDLGWDRSMRGPTPDEDPEWHRDCKPWLVEIRTRKAKSDPLIRAELERLEALWEAR
ncbi:hypothetical protein N9917_03515 [Deltaproteobacteria bacterium]|nr:hypothetical protein [Deltaproteobacteria bacterium]